MDFFDKILNFLGLERKFTPASDMNWTRIDTLVHGPGTPPWGDHSSGDSNSAVFACLMALAMAYPEPPVRVFRRRGGREYAIPDHPLYALLDKPTPNGELSMEDIWFWTAWAKHTDGNAYWLKVRSGNAETGNVVQLWPISPALMTPVTERGRDGRPLDWISYYRYQVAPNEWEKVPVNNVIHFRLGVDDQDMRKGLSPLKRLVRQVSTDEEADKFVDALLKNYAVPGLVVIPGSDVVVDRDAAERIKAAMAQSFTGDRRGAIAVLSQESKVEQFGFSPEELNMSVLHRIPEERISAVIGVPAIVAGLGAGLDRATYSNFREAREMMTEQKLAPMWRQDAARLNVSLKPDFSSDRNVYIKFDLTDVRALQEDEDSKYNRLNIGVLGGWITPDEARAEVGFDPMATTEEGTAESGTKSDTPILGYHIEQGVVSRNEARAALALPPEDTAEGDNLRRLTAQLTVAQMARNAGIPTQEALKLVGLNVDIAPADEEPTQEEGAEGEKRLPFGSNGYRFKQVPPPQTGNTRMDTELRRYHEEINTLCGRALAGDISESQFRQRMVELTAAAILAMFLLAGGDPGSESGRQQLAEQQQIARDSARGLADDIYGGRYEDEETGAEALENRIVLWGVTLAGVYAIGQLNKPPTVRPDGTEVEVRLRWQRGATEKPCQTCLSLDGVVLTTSEWQRLGLRPTSPDLDCGGWQCACTWTETDEESVGLESVAV